MGGNFGWTGRVQAYFNEAHNWYKAMQTRFTRRFSDGWSAQINYTLQPGFWQLDMSLFKNFWLAPDRRLEIRIESVNVLNHVNLGNPDSTIGVPGNDNPNAGRITSTAGNYSPRNFQFGFRFVF